MKLLQTTVLLALATLAMGCGELQARLSDEAAVERVLLEVEVHDELLDPRILSAELTLGDAALETADGRRFLLSGFGEVPAQRALAVPDPASPRPTGRGGRVDLGRTGLPPGSYDTLTLTVFELSARLASEESPMELPGPPRALRIAIEPPLEVAPGRPSRLFVDLGLLGRLSLGEGATLHDTPAAPRAHERSSTGSIRGLALADSTQDPLANAVIEVLRPGERSGPVHRTRTDAFGSFFVPCLAAGSYDVRALGDGATAPKALDVQVTPGARALVLRAPPGPQPLRVAGGGGPR